MKVYIAGKITGDPLYRAKFEKAQERLKAQGHVVLNPAVLPDGLSSSEAMRICFAMIDVADLVCLLDDYYRSPGALLERDYALYIGTPCELI